MNPLKPQQAQRSTLTAAILLSSALTCTLPASAQSEPSDDSEYLVNRILPALLGDEEACIPDLADRAAIAEDLAAGAISLEADQTELEDKNTLIMSGNAEVQHNGMVVTADKLRYDRSRDHFEAEGNIRVQAPEGHIIEADTVEMEVETSIGSAENVRYQVADTLRKPGEQDKTFIRAHGEARRVDIEGHDIVILHDATYTTCRREQEDVIMQAGRIALDNSNGVGTAKNLKVRLFDVPVFYFPYVSFPINDNRKSGFLMPSIGSNSRSGTIVKIPYYWNIAPNMDATITGKTYSKRGVQLQGEYRYLAEDFNGLLLGEYLPSDNAFGDEDRYGYHLRHNHDIAARWRGDVNYTKVSDERYFDDFSDDLRFTSATHLAQNARLSYTGDWIRADALYSEYQTIDETIPDARRPYTRQPQIDIRTNLPRVNNFRFDWPVQLVNFQRDDRVSGPRLDMTPSVAYEAEALYGFVKPKVSWRYTQYDLENVEADQPSSPSRSVGIFSLDSGLFFDRETVIKDTDFTHTLEPRLFYLYVPYEDQDDLPIFDTGETSVSYGSLFRENRYSGADRVGDTNQLTAALTSRLLNAETGGELARGTLGQIYFFEDRRVTSSGVPDTSTKSDVFAELYVTLNNHFRMYNYLQYDVEESTIGNGKIDLRYTDLARKKFNLGYYYNNGGSEQVSADFAWPLAPRWDLAASTRYSLSDSKSLQSAGGIAYNACCWSVRLSAQRRVDSDSEYVNSVMLELELNGLTKLRTAF